MQRLVQMFPRLQRNRNAGLKKHLVVPGVLAGALLWDAFQWPVHASTEMQREAMFRHGIWEWSLQNCPGAFRNKGYWFALKEYGGFKNSDQIVRNEEGRPFRQGWGYMASNAATYGLKKTCDYAFEQWPAVLYRE